ncbi:MAG: RluA family pseudouridine synthase [Chloroflexi bacterium HGW-Chloroflexi-10]|nr:MAG: RluA family pseudouridine synthase [Chloroflexi bacterium HGW-Chloroflexi-10]
MKNSYNQNNTSQVDYKLNEKIIYIDQDILIVNKPSGLRTIQDGYLPSIPNLKSILEINFGKIWIVHRLDKETSGVLIVARNKEAHKKLNTQFENRTIQKTYVARTHNIPSWSTYQLIINLKINGDRRHRTIIGEKGKISQTNFKVMDSNSITNFSLIYAAPHTGYTHQIRAHLAFLGFPIYGDILYQIPDDITAKTLNQNASRLFLHAVKIIFQHPVLNKEMIFSSPLPDEFLLQ